MTKELSIEEIAALAAEAEDQSEVTSGGDFNDDPPPEGLTVMRLIEYIELGKQKQKPWQGKAKPDAEEVRVTFELLHPTKNITEYEVEGVKKKTGQLLSLKMRKSTSENAKFRKLFLKLQYGRTDKKHIAQMLGEAFVVTIFHNKSEDGSKVYANMNPKGGEYTIAAPYKVDAITNEKQMYDILPPTKPLRLFVWGSPTRGTWDSLFIDGTKEVTAADGTKTEVSKNWLQETVLGASNFRGSPLDLLLNGVTDEMLNEPAKNGAKVETKAAEQTVTEEEMPAEDKKTENVEATAASAASTANVAATSEPASSATTATKSPSDVPTDALAMLGLVQK